MEQEKQIEYIILNWKKKKIYASLFSLVAFKPTKLPLVVYFYLGLEEVCFHILMW